MSEQHRARGDFADEVQQLLAIGVRGEVEVLHLATTGYLTCAGAENKALPVPRGFEPPAWSVGVRIADEENRLARVTHDTHRQVVCGGILTHHARGEYKNAPSGQLHLVDLSLLHDLEIERFRQAQAGMLPVCP